jgi:hypothetical protein
MARASGWPGHQDGQGIRMARASGWPPHHAELLRDGGLRSSRSGRADKVQAPLLAACVRKGPAGMMHALGGDVPLAPTSRESPEGCGASCTCSMARAALGVPAGLPPGAASLLHVRVACRVSRPRSLARSRRGARAASERAARALGERVGAGSTNTTRRPLSVAPAAVARAVNGASESLDRLHKSSWRRSRAS